MKQLHIYLLICILCLCGCGTNTSHRACKIGVDPSWYPLNFHERTNTITAFSTQLLADIGRVEKISFVKITVNWDDLIEGLNKGHYEAILTSMPPYIFNQKLFNYSNIYLALGPVLVVPVSSSIHSLDQLQGREVGIVKGASGISILEQAPDAIIRFYDSTPSALNALADGALDAVMVDVLSGTAYCNDLYEGKLKVATPPLNDEGLRLVTKKENGTSLIKRFDAGLKIVQSNGSYAELLKKWSLEQ